MIQLKEEIEVMQLQANECQGTPPPEARKDKEGVFSESQREHGSADTLILDS